MTNTPQDIEQMLKEDSYTFKLIFSLGFIVIFAIAMVGTLTGMRWRSWLPGAESCKSVFGGVEAAVYSFMSHTL